MQFLDIFTIIIGIIMSLAYYPQAYKIWKRRSAGDISISAFFILSAGTTTWLVYGIAKNDFVIVSGFLLGAIGSWLVFFLSLYFKNK